MSKRNWMLKVVAGLLLCTLLGSTDHVAAQGSRFQWVPDTQAAELARNGWQYVYLGKNFDDGEDIYVCRAYIETRSERGWNPGKMQRIQHGRSKLTMCLVPFDGKEWKFGPGSYQVLMAAPGAYTWQPGPIALATLQRNNETPTSSVFYNHLGYGVQLYSCAIYDRQAGYHAGKLSFAYDPNGICYIPYGGREHPFTSGYYVLVAQAGR